MRQAGGRIGRQRPGTEATGRISQFGAGRRYATTPGCKIEDGPGTDADETRTGPRAERRLMRGRRVAECERSDPERSEGYGRRAEFPIRTLRDYDQVAAELGGGGGAACGSAQRDRGAKRWRRGPRARRSGSRIDRLRDEVARRARRNGGTERDRARRPARPRRQRSQTRQSADRGRRERAHE